MEKYKFDEIKYYATYLWADLNKKDQDDLWMLGLLSKEFSDSRMKCIHSFNYGSWQKHVCFQTSSKYNWESTSSVTYSQETREFGYEIKIVAFLHLHIMLALDICWGKNDPNNNKLKHYIF